MRELLRKAGGWDGDQECRVQGGEREEMISIKMGYFRAEGQEPVPVGGRLVWSGLVWSGRVGMLQGHQSKLKCSGMDRMNRDGVG